MGRIRGSLNKKTLARMARGETPAFIPLPNGGGYYSSRAGLTSAQPTAPDSGETDAQIRKRLADRFHVIETMVRGTCKGKHRSLIISGPAGLSKSYTAEKVVAECDPNEERTRYCKGFTRLTGIYRALYDMRNGGIVVFDDCDSIFFDNDALNLLKSATDTIERRRIFWGAETTMTVKVMTENEEGEEVEQEIEMPTSFDFNGAVIFLTNCDLESMANQGGRLSEHFRALISRSHYIDCGMRTKRDYLIRIKQVVEMGMLRDRGFKKKEEDEILAYVMANKDDLRELTLRVVLKIAELYREYPSNWKKYAKQACHKERVLTPVPTPPVAAPVEPVA